MSTHCQLRFVEKDSDRVVQIYRHSDGYPKSVLTKLEHLQELLHATGTQRDASYTAAQFLLVDKLWRIERLLRLQDKPFDAYPASVMGLLDVDAWEETSTTPSHLQGHGVEDPSCGIRGNENYLYIITLPASSSTEKLSEWRIKFSEYGGFPQWNDEETKQAFDRADWHFDGTLGDAVMRVDSDE